MDEHNGLGLMVLAVTLVGAQIVLSAATKCNVSDPAHVTAVTKYHSTEALPGVIGGVFGAVAIFGFVRSGRRRDQQGTGQRREQGTLHGERKQDAESSRHRAAA